MNILTMTFYIDFYSIRRWLHFCFGFFVSHYRLVSLSPMPKCIFATDGSESPTTVAYPPFASMEIYLFVLYVRFRCHFATISLYFCLEKFNTFSNVPIFEENAMRRIHVGCEFSRCGQCDIIYRKWKKINFDRIYRNKINHTVFFKKYIRHRVS